MVSLSRKINRLSYDRKKIDQNWILELFLRSLELYLLTTCIKPSKLRTQKHNSQNSLETQVWLIMCHLILYFEHYNWYQKKAGLIDNHTPFAMFINVIMEFTVQLDMNEGLKLNLAVHQYFLAGNLIIVFIFQWLRTKGNTQWFAKISFLTII